MGAPGTTEGPWTFEAFNEIFAGEPNYGAMLLGADGETIVAQCVADRDTNQIAASGALYDALEAIAEEAWHYRTGTGGEGLTDSPLYEQAVAALALARGEQPNHPTEGAI